MGARRIVTRAERQQWAEARADAALEALGAALLGGAPPEECEALREAFQRAWERASYVRPPDGSL